jgi:hypothetical protein
MLVAMSAISSLRLLAGPTGRTVPGDSFDWSAALLGEKQLMAITTHLLHGNSDEKPDTNLH